MNYQSHTRQISLLKFYLWNTEQSAYVNLVQKPWENEQCVLQCFLLIAKPCYVAGEVVSNIKTLLPHTHNILRWGGSERGGSKQREKGKEGVARERRNQADSRKSSNDGSGQRTTCQTLKVISCFIEDFYGILAAWLTSQREGKTERESSGPSHSTPPPPSFPPIFYSIQSLYPQLYFVRLNRATTTRVSPVG